MHASREEMENYVKAQPDHYTACTFLGRGRYDTVRDLPDLQHARTAAKAQADKYRRPCMIYAVRGTSDAYMGTEYPANVRAFL